jgi:peptidoglycan/xylan/chitin deacetylase (PgdA/CDA1 family)
MPRHIVCLTFDFDTQSGFIARGMTTPTPLSRGEFGALASRRILAFLKSRDIATTWCVPGFTIESWPKECAAVVEHGHEIANHSWAHIPSATMTREEEEADLVRANEAIVRLTGRKPRGYRSASWDLSASTIDLLIAHGFVYDSSLMGGDYLPYRARRGDVAVLGKPYEFGVETSLIEMPISWSLDDYPHFEYMRNPNGSIQAGLMNATNVLENFVDDYTYMTRVQPDFGILTYTFHPHVIGRGHRMMMLERLIQKLMEDGAVFMTMEAAMAEWLARQQSGRKAAAE